MPISSQCLDFVFNIITVIILLNKLNNFIFYSKTCAVVIYWTSSLLVDIQNPWNSHLLQLWLYCMSFLICVSMKDWHLEWAWPGGRRCKLCVAILLLVEAPDCFPPEGAEQGNGAPQALYCPFPSQPPAFGASGVAISCLASVLCHGDKSYEEVEFFCLIILFWEND